MVFASLLRYVNMGRKDGWDDRFSIPYFWKLMADKYSVGINYIISEHGLDDICEKCDGLIVPGSSNDINPSYWGGEPFSGNVAYDEFAFDAKVIDWFVKHNKPIFGVCGGLQSINVHLGGSLKKVDPKMHSGAENKNHIINVKENSFVYDVFKSTKADVNTYHNWAIDRLAPGFEVVAKSEDDVIEAIECKEKRIFATQWHPERNFAEGDPIENKFFENFINLCK